MAAKRLDIDHHADAGGNRRDARAHLFDHTHHLVAHGDARHGTRHAAVLYVQVARANAGKGDSDYGVAVVGDGGARLV